MTTPLKRGFHYFIIRIFQFISSIDTCRLIRLKQSSASLFLPAELSSYREQSIFGWIVALTSTWRNARSFKKWGPKADRKSTLLNSSHMSISYAVFCLKKKKHKLEE